MIGYSSAKHVPERFSKQPPSQIDIMMSRQTPCPLVPVSWQTQNSFLWLFRSVRNHNADVVRWVCRENNQTDLYVIVPQMPTLTVHTALINCSVMRSSSVRAGIPADRQVRYDPAGIFKGTLDVDGEAARRQASGRSVRRRRPWRNGPGWGGTPDGSCERTRPPPDSASAEY